MNDDLLIELQPIEDKSHGIIKVIGVGGGGGNAVRNMFRKHCEGVSFAVCNTDSQALARTEIPVRVQLGSEGLGVGGDPIKGKAKAEESLNQIENLINDGTQMVFITAGMGGGTGTGAAPVIAQMARDRGILTVGVVTSSETPAPTADQHVTDDVSTAAAGDTEPDTDCADVETQHTEVATTNTDDAATDESQAIDADVSAHDPDSDVEKWASKLKRFLKGIVEE